MPSLLDGSNVTLAYSLERHVDPTLQQQCRGTQTLLSNQLAVAWESPDRGDANAHLHVS